MFCRFLINVTLRRIFTEVNLLNKQKTFVDMTSHLIVEAYNVSSKKEKKININDVGGLKNVITIKIK